ncbi:MAG: hypothetical protein CSA09_02550 [Candidatus Contendobacter odensis]|uniref:Protein kinase domain-containing protein n=1 Tax=Candidatus Contendibacter odensensis TaxID=1400860 RepID=A0A2G6PFP4_9GAMM|nr:MAG: hypothetical protein CSA09_02550 [Candidatus Contendobacter odensis]
MDIKLEAEIKDLADAYLAGDLDEAALARSIEALLSAAGSDIADTLMDDDAHVNELVPGVVIGPPECRVRLLHDLSGHQRVWLAQLIGLAEAFRVVKVFRPDQRISTAGVGSNEDERSVRADLVGLRTYLAKVRARVDLAVKLTHPNIVKIYGWRQGAGGWPFVEMGYVSSQKGSTLEQLIEQKGTEGFAWGTIVQWLRPVAAALDYAHQEHRLAHQHLDADSVFVSSDGEVKLLGFGVATEVHEPRSVLFSVKSLSAETTAESASSKTMFRRDVYALALLIYRLLSGRSAYEVQAHYPNVISRPPGLTDEAWRTLRQGLAYPSELCPAEAGAFVASLEKAQRVRKTAQQLRKPSFLAQYRWLVAGVGVAVFAGTAGLFAYKAQSPEVGPPIEQPSPVEARPQPAVSPAEQDKWRYAGREENAEYEADRRAFESAQRENTQVAYQLYLQRCPRCGYGQEAKEAIEKLAFQEKVASIKKQFESHIMALEQGKKGNNGSKALAQLDVLEKLASDETYVVQGRRRIARAWITLSENELQKRKLASSKKWYRKALALQPDLPELKILGEALQEAGVQKTAEQKDSQAFSIARQENTRKAYWEYLSRCAPVCRYRASATKALARLAPRNRVFQDRLADGSLGPEMVMIPAGHFMMGSPLSERGRYKDEARHLVQIKKPFAIGKYEVMFHEYDRFAAASGRVRPGDNGWGRGRRPVINVSWQDTKTYADWLSKQTKHRYRLPTEAEWEYAIRAGVKSSRYWGNDPDEGCLYANAADLDGKELYVGWPAMKCRDGYIYTAPVGTYHSNNFGLHDMAGNVLEWTCTLYDEQYRAPIQRCQEPTADRQFVIRGGSWNDEPRSIRSAERHRDDPQDQNYSLGFRLVRELP